MQLHSNMAIRGVCFLCVMCLLGGCASVDFDTPRVESTALADTSDTTLASRVERMSVGSEGQSGFYPLLGGIDSLALRLLLAGRAERSIDVQYYLISGDVVGGVFGDALLQAADRGVRVRLLLDDIQTKGQDPSLVALNAHPNIEVRVFNPFARRGWRVLDGLTDYKRVNRRMHNKTFVVDNQVAIIGGRNMAAEYFDAHDEQKFGDLDVLCVGPVVPDTSTMFDLYWNHRMSVPVAGFAKMPKDESAELLALRGRLDDFYEGFLQTPYAKALDGELMRQLTQNGDFFVRAPYQLAYDSPDKGEGRLENEEERIQYQLIESIQRATEELIFISPYFVPRQRGVDYLIELQQSGVDVLIVTNSLASNNQPLVHGGYMGCRKELLENGVRLLEVRSEPDRSSESDPVRIGAKKATLHSKAFIVDRKELFVGSFNFDPRSAHINTESGVIIQSPELAQKLAARIDEKGPVNAYEVFLNDKGQLRWKYFNGEEWVIFSKEPNTSFLKRFMARVTSLLPIKSQL